MKLKRRSDDSNEIISIAISILAILLMLFAAFPSFAVDEEGANEAEASGNAVLIEEIPEEMKEDAEGTDNENAQEETAENAGGAESDKGTDAVDKEPVKEEPQKQSYQAKKALAKADKGETVSYTAKKVGSNAGETSVFSVTSGDTKFTGSCAQQGVTMKTSGKATITRISNGTKIAKVIYHYAIGLGDKNWWTSDHNSDKVGTLLGMSSNDATNVTKRRMVEAFCQIYNMGSSDWYKTITNANTGGWSTDTADKVRDYYSNINDESWYKNLTVPDGFEIWFGDAGDAQPFIIWAYTEPTPEPPPETPPEPPVPEVKTGFVTMKKVSGDTNITG